MKVGAVCVVYMNANVVMLIVVFTDTLVLGAGEGNLSSSIHEVT